MKYCNNCGKKLINGSNYCDNCGYKVLEEQKEDKIIKNDGKITPMVDRRAPKKPACDEPTKVAMLTASGPGVDSDTATKFKNSDSVSHPF